MAHPYWPPFDLSVVTPRLSLRYIDDDLAAQLVRVAAAGIHEPDYMPFLQPWTLAESPHMERSALQYYWRTRSAITSDHWELVFAVLVDGAVVGSSGVQADHFRTVRTFETGSWLGREFQGSGLGTELRLATLHLGFIGLEAHVATTTAFDDNQPSLGVTRKLGYESNGEVRIERLGELAVSKRFQMTRDHFNTKLRRNDIEVVGASAVRDLLAINP